MSYEEKERYLRFMRKRNELTQEWVEAWLAVGRPDKAQQTLRRFRVVEKLSEGAPWMVATPLFANLRRITFEYTPEEFLVNADIVFGALDAVDMFVEGFREGANWAWNTPPPRKAAA